MKLTSVSLRSLDITLTIEEVLSTSVNKEKIIKGLNDSLIHIVRVPVEVYKEFQSCQIRDVIRENFQNKCEIVYYIVTEDVNKEQKLQCFRATWI